MSIATAGADPPAFVFIGDALPLDFVNTEVVVRGKRRDLLADPANLARWWDAARLRYPGAGLDADHPFLAPPDEELLTAARSLRAALRAIFGAVADGAPIPADHLAALNRILRTGFTVVSVATDGQPYLSGGSHDPGADGLLFPLGRAAAELLTAGEPARLHRCENERCILLFYDTTRSATRRWCSTGCMERARSLRRYREQKAGGERRAPRAHKSPLPSGWEGAGHSLDRG
ncbi:MAG: ABATE domain-containing protein [Thermomicrobiales bacterium]